MLRALAGHVAAPGFCTSPASADGRDFCFNNPSEWCLGDVNCWQRAGGFELLTGAAHNTSELQPVVAVLMPEAGNPHLGCSLLVVLCRICNA